MARSTVATTALVATLCLAACTASPQPDGERTSPSPSPTPTEPPVHRAELRLPEDPVSVLDADDAAARATAASATFFASAPVAVVAPADDVAAQVRAASLAVALGAPVLLDAPADDAAPDPDDSESTDDAESTASPPPPPEPDPTDEELERLGVLAVLTVGEVDLGVDVPVVSAPQDPTDLAELLDRELTEADEVPEGRENVSVRTLDRSDPALLTVAPPADSEETPSAETEDAATDVASPDPTGTPGTGDDGADEDSADDDGAGQDGGTELPRTELADPPDGGLLLTTGTVHDLAAVATARAAGVDVLRVPGGDPRATSTTVQAFAEHESSAVVAVGPQFGSVEDLGWKVETARTGVELPGGGQTVFRGKRMVALYGTPSNSGLGVLGEQGVQDSIDRARGLARNYQEHTDDDVVPAFEMIVTVASAGAGSDGNYSNELDVSSFVPWVEAAQEAGVYVVLDLQPGRTDFVTQAKEYEELLRYPHVGLALDPEWRLEDDQVHLRQIGRVHADEVNEVIAYLADLTRSEALPQKLVILHQFRLSMITDREDVDTSRDELAVLIHADGQGSQGAKTGTWNALRTDAPENVTWGWKNFYDEDSPMLTVAETYQVEPKPHFVSYQ